VKGLKSLGRLNLFCSLETARPLLLQRTDQTTYYLARCRQPEDAPWSFRRLKCYPYMSAFTTGRVFHALPDALVDPDPSRGRPGFCRLSGLAWSGGGDQSNVDAATAASLAEFAT